MNTNNLILCFCLLVEYANTAVVVNNSNNIYLYKYDTNNKIQNDVTFELCGAKKCVYKCCPDNEVVNDEKQCVPYEVKKNFSNITVYDYYMNEMKKGFHDIFNTVGNRLETDENFANNSYASSFIGSEVFLEQSGVLYLHNPNQWERWIPIKDFCIDYSLSENATVPEPIFLVDYVVVETRVGQSIILTIALWISTVFLSLVLVIYAILPHLQNLVGKILMSYVTSYISYFIFIGLVVYKEHSAETCIVLSFFTYFSIMAVCCWMNIMSLDIWWTFRGYAKNRQIHRRGETKKFIRYCYYGWGVPLFMASCLMIINSIDFSDMPWFITPQIPVLGCYLKDGQQLVYMYIPMLIFILVNCIFFVMTGFKIIEAMKGNEILGAAAAMTQRERFLICLKLLVIMGIGWIWEVISFLVPAADALADYLDVYNGLIGIFIFIIFICKKKMFKNLKKRFMSFRNPGAVTTNTTAQSNGQGGGIPMSRLNNTSQHSKSQYNF